MSWPLVLAFFICGSSPRAWGLWDGGVVIPYTISVHPHVRGVYEAVLPCHVLDGRFIPTCVGFITMSSLGLPSSPGSSPRAWGLCLLDLLLQRLQRFIPTCVGFMSAWSENCSLVSGTSPRAWGLFIVHHRRYKGIRFIPTCVGFMLMSCITLTTPSVHPHVRGVYVMFHNLLPNLLRFIPTCVGFMR